MIYRYVTCWPSLCYENDHDTYVRSPLGLDGKSVLNHITLIWKTD